MLLPFTFPLFLSNNVPDILDKNTFERTKDIITSLPTNAFLLYLIHGLYVVQPVAASYNHHN